MIAEVVKEVHCRLGRQLIDQQRSHRDGEEGQGEGCKSVREPGLRTSAATDRPYIGRHVRAQPVVRTVAASGDPIRAKGVSKSFNWRLVGSIGGYHELAHV